MKKLMLVLAVAGVVAVWPASSGAATFKGVVVGKERGAVLVASPSGLVRAAAGRARVGARVTVVANRVRVVGRAHTAHLHAVVVRRSGAAVFLASNHHLLAMRAERTAAAPLKPGEVVATKVSIENGQLEENETEDLGEDQVVQVQALVTAVAPGLLTVSVNNQSLTIRLPAGLTLPQSLVGQMVTVQLRLDQDNENENEDNDNANDNANNAPTGTVVGGGTGGGGGDDGDHGGGGHDDGGGDHGGGGDDGGGHH